MSSETPSLKYRDSDSDSVYSESVAGTQSSMSERPTGGVLRGGSFADQYLAIMQRTFRQMMRKPFDLMLECIIPLLFVVITLILWAVWPPAKGLERQFISYDYASNIVMNGDLQRIFICTNSTYGNVGNLQDCSTLESFLSAMGVELNISCAGDESSLPPRVDGICYIDVGPIEFNDFKYNGFVIGTIEGSMVPVQAWLNAYSATMFTIPSLDEIIAFQWLARKSTSKDGLQSVVSAGLLPHTKQTAVYCSGQLYFVGDDIDGLVQYFDFRSTLFHYVYNGTYSSSEIANELVRNTRYNWAVIEVNSLTRDKFEVNIRMNSSALPMFGAIVDGSYAGGYNSERSDLYAVSGFLTFQQIITEYYVQYVLGNETSPEIPASHYFASAGYVDFHTEPILTIAGIILPFIFVLSFLYPVSQMTKRIVLEKEMRIREAMMIMALGNTPLYLSWFTRFMVPNLFIALLICVILKVTYMSISSIFIFVLIFVLYVIVCVPMAGMFSSFFSKARLASLMAPIIYFIFAVPVFAISSAGAGVITFFCIFPPTAFSVAFITLIQHEARGGFGSKDWKDKNDVPQMYMVMIMMGIDIVVYILLMLYFDAVLPKDWGTPRHPLFFIIDPIRRCRGTHSKNLEGGPDGRAKGGVFEELGDISDNAVDLCGLRKEYKRGGKKFLAVNNLYWGMRDSQISVLLGHNGAGKTTVLNMMTGMIEPDQGDCYVYGLSVRTELSKVRKQIGYCPQHNILWPELTCREHLEFFGKIKGLKGWELEDAVCRMLYETDLMDKMDYPSRTLSGGQKRKLSVAVAFVASSRLIFLDEPTAGMDVGARRYTWELLRRMSEVHTIMLTTHYMDEADLLGHRIGIMSQGRLKCSGSSLFLKTNLGVGYSITLSLLNDADVESLDDLVLGAVNGATLIGLNGCEAMYRLPNQSVRQFPELLDALDDQEEELGVRGYSLSATTLEEVFLRVSEDDIQLIKSHDPLMQTSQAVIDKQENLIWNCEIVESRSAMWWSQFKASMLKRLLNGLRDRRMQCFQLVCPMVCILIAMLLSLINLGGPDNLVISSDMYRSQYMVDMAGCDEVLGSKAAYDTFIVRHHDFPNALNLSYYEVDTFLVQNLHRLGGLFCKDPELANTTDNEHNFVHLINSSTYHQAPISMHAFYKSMRDHLTSFRGAFKLVAGTMPRTQSEKVMEDAAKTIVMGAIIMIPFSFLPSNPVAWVVKERECKARHLQNVSGLRFFIYWLSNFLFDMAAYLITMFLVIIIFVIFNRREYMAPDRFGGTFVLFFLYGLCSTTWAYVCSFAFKEHSTAQTVVLAFSFVTGFLLVMIVYVLTLLPNTSNAAKKLRFFTRIIPSFSIGEGIINMAVLTHEQDIGLPIKLWDMDTLGWVCVYMAIEIPVFAIFTLIIDHPARRTWGQKRNYDRNARPQEISDEDSDVEEEREAIYALEEKDEHNDMVRVVDLRKVYPNGKEAVRNITFGVMPGEVFGFLGTNGAGKTTAISILCQEFNPTSGSAYICGYDVVDDSAEALQCIGYCPQFDATLDLLTVEEHLRLYAGVRGIVYHQRDNVVGTLLRMCELSLYRSSLSSQLSGGNRRKLSFAMSLVGGPSVVFLDEPSAGMDPVARRGLWNAIEKVADNSSVVLTTHHLEEVEALAHRVAIMVDGTLRCIGDKTHLKKKYGTGFEMTVRVSKEKYCGRLRRWVRKNLSDAELSECKGERFVYTLPPEVILSHVFRSLQKAKVRLHITDYSVSQTSIEQVFLKISGELEDDRPHHASFKKS